MDAIRLYKFRLVGRGRGKRFRLNGRGFLFLNRSGRRGRRLTGRSKYWFRGGFRCGWFECSRFRGGRGGTRVCVAHIILNGIFLEKTEDVVENKVAVGLFCKEECLDKLSPGITTVRHFADDLNDNAAVGRGLRVYGVDENFAVLETDGSDLVVDLLNT